MVGSYWSRDLFRRTNKAFRIDKSDKLKKIIEAVLKRILSFHMQNQ